MGRGAPVAGNEREDAGDDLPDQVGLRGWRLRERPHPQGALDHCPVPHQGQAPGGQGQGGTSDSYAVVKYGKHYTKKTMVIAKTTAPIWAETFVMERTHGRHGDVIGVEVFDKDKSSPTALASVK